MAGKVEQGSTQATPTAREKTKRPAVASDVAKALRFIGRLAVRLQANATLSGKGSLIEKALSRAVEQLPEGSLKATLLGDPARFADALGARIGSLTGVSTPTPKSPETDQEVVDVLTDSGYKAALQAVTNGATSSWKRKGYDSWSLSLIKVLNARIPPPAAVVAAQFAAEDKLANSARGSNPINSADVAVQTTGRVPFHTGDPDTAISLLTPGLEVLESAIKHVAASASGSSEHAIPKAVIRKQLKRCQCLIDQLNVSIAVRRRLAARPALTHFLPSPPKPAPAEDAETPEQGAATIGAKLGLLTVAIKVLYVRLAEPSGQKEDTAALRTVAAKVGANLWKGAEEKVLEMLASSLQLGWDLSAEEDALIRTSLAEVLLLRDSATGLKEKVPVRFWLKKAAVARAVGALLRKQGDRTRAQALVFAARSQVPGKELVAVVGNAVRQMKSKFGSLDAVPLESSQSLAAWLLALAPETFFHALLAHDTFTDSSRKPAQPAPAPDEPLFVIDKGTTSNLDAMFEEAAGNLAQGREQTKKAVDSPSSSEAGTEDVPDWMRDSDDDDGEVGAKADPTPEADDMAETSNRLEEEATGQVAEAEPPSTSDAVHIDEGFPLLHTRSGKGTSATPAKQKVPQVTSATPAKEKVPKGKVGTLSKGLADELSPLHTRSGRTMQTPKPPKTSSEGGHKRKSEPDEEPAEPEETYISPLHTRSGKVVSATPAKKVAAAKATPLRSTRKRSKALGQEES